MFDYSKVKPIHIDIVEPTPHVPEKLMIRFHPDGSNKAWVEPSSGEFFSRLMTVGSDPWIATIDVQRTKYQEALLNQLAKDGRDCQIEESVPYPDYYAFEFRFSCPKTGE